MVAELTVRRFPWFECVAFAVGYAYFFGMASGRALWTAEDRSQLFWLAPIWCGITLALACRVFKPWFKFSYGAAFYTGFLATWLAAPIAFAGAMDFSLGWRGAEAAIMGVFAMTFIWSEPGHYFLAPILGVALHRILLALNCRQTKAG